MERKGLIQSSNPQAIRGLTLRVWSYGYLEMWDISIAAEFGSHDSQQEGWCNNGEARESVWEKLGQRYGEGESGSWNTERERASEGEMFKMSKDWRIRTAGESVRKKCNQRRKDTVNKRERNEQNEQERISSDFHPQRRKRLRRAALQK